MSHYLALRLPEYFTLNGLAADSPASTAAAAAKIRCALSHCQSGGDPNTAPHLFTLTVAKADGKVSVDDPVSGETRVIE